MYDKKKLEKELELYEAMEALCEEFTREKPDVRLTQLLIDIAFYKCIAQDKLRRIENGEN